MFLTRRQFLRETAAISLAGGLLANREFASAVEPDRPPRPARMLLDMVHNNPGEQPFVTHYNDPKFLHKLGYRTKVYELFQSAQFGIDWSSVDADVFPAGSAERAWVDQKAAELDKLYATATSTGLSVYCHTDMIVFPKALVEKHQLGSFKDVSNPRTQQYLRLAVRQMFSRFPQLDGLVVRIGETYLQGAPYHTGGITGKQNPVKTIVPLIKLLREEVCETLKKTLIFRSWLSFDQSVADYHAVSNGVEPHENLHISVKHCEGDFHRGNPFSKVLGLGRHTQVVEVQCQREYEGKGAFPNYVAHGVIEGFPEHNGLSVRKIWGNPLIAGMFTWSRGGGWKGPYITNELWCDLNVYVLAQWAQHPDRGEDEIFNEFCTAKLMLSADDTATFRKLCLLSADAVYRAVNHSNWTRDQYLARPNLQGKSPDEVAKLLQAKDEAVAMWKDIVAYADGIRFPDSATGEYVTTSCRYGLYLYTIGCTGFHIAALGDTGDKGDDGDKQAMKKLIEHYDQTWTSLKTLRNEHPSCATLYQDVDFLDKPGMGAMVDKYREVLRQG